MRVHARLNTKQPNPANPKTSGNAATTEPFQAAQRKAFNGMALLTAQIQKLSTSLHAR